MLSGRLNLDELGDRARESYRIALESFCYRNDLVDVLSDAGVVHAYNYRAPFGQDLYDFPVVAGDPIHLLIIKAIGIFTSNPAAVMNVFYVLQFPIAGVAYELRRLSKRLR